MNDKEKDVVCESDKKIKSKVIKSAKWTTTKSIFNMAYGPVYKIVLALIVSPLGFAYISAIKAVLNIGDLLSRIGFSQALIVENDSGKKQFSTVFWIDLLTAFLTGVGIFIAAPWVEKFYELSNLKEMITVASVCVFLTGITRTFKCYLQKNLRLDINVKIDIIDIIVDTISTVVFIILMDDITGYIYGTLVSRFVYLALYAYCAFRQGYRMGFYFDKSFLYKVRNFAGSVSFRQIFDYFARIADELLIARLFEDKSILGIYYFAKDLIAKPGQVITTAVSQVALSALAKFTDNMEKFNAIYLKISKCLAIASFSVFGGIALTAGEFVPVLFGNEYIDAIIYVQCFAITSAISTVVTSPASAVLYAKRKPGAIMWLDIFNNAIYLLLLLLLGRFGVIYVLITKMISSCASIPLTNGVTRRALDMPMSRFAGNLKSVFLAAICMIISVLGIKLLIPESLGYLTELCVAVVVGVAVFLILMWKSERKMLLELISMIKGVK